MITNPTGVIITAGAKEIAVKGGWRNYLNQISEINNEVTTWWYRCGNAPKRTADLIHVYICAGGRIRMRAFFAGVEGPKEMVFGHGPDSEALYGKGWLILGGPLEMAPRKIHRKGFQGFRYVEEPMW